MSYHVKRRSRVKRPFKVVGFWRNPSHPSKRGTLSARDYADYFLAAYEAVRSSPLAGKGL